MEIRRLTEKDDLKKVAELIYDADEWLFPYVFGKKGKALPLIEKMVGLEYNYFSYNKGHVFLEDGEIIGVIFGYDEKEFSDKLSNSEIIDSAPALQLLQIAKRARKIAKCQVDCPERNMYVIVLSVDELWRRQGVGTGLLGCFREYARKQGYKAITIEVRGENLSAMKFCERFGFKTLGSRSLPNGDTAVRLYMNI